MLKRCILKINMQNVFYRHKRDKTFETIAIIVLSHNYSLFFCVYNLFYKIINFSNLLISIVSPSRIYLILVIQTVAFL